MTIKDILNEFESFAPTSLQETYDNSGLIVGNSENEVSAVLVCLDSTEDVVEEAIAKKCNLIIAHHPIVFSGLKSITGKNYIERVIIKAIKNDIAIYACHTNLDNVLNGVNGKIAEKLGLVNCKILAPKKNSLKKLQAFCPAANVAKIRVELGKAGAGNLGNYTDCSFNTEGTGTFKAGENANPFIGEIGKLHTENEAKLEMIFPAYLESKIVTTLIKNHPYEEVAFDIINLENTNNEIGSGIIGELKNEQNETDFLTNLKTNLNTQLIRHTKLIDKPIKKVAICGGSGSFLLNKAMEQKADIFITGDFKYHEFFDANNKIIIADVGHYESEQFTKELLHDVLTKKFTTFATYISDINTNPIHYI